MDLEDITKDVIRIGIYLLFAEEELMYVGQSSNATRRTAVHKGDKVFDAVWFIPFDFDEGKRLTLESYLIDKMKPKLNRTGNWGRGGFKPSGGPPMSKDEALEYVRKLNLGNVFIKPDPAELEIVKKIFSKKPSRPNLGDVLIDQMDLWERPSTLRKQETIRRL